MHTMIHAITVMYTPNPPRSSPFSSSSSSTSTPTLIRSIQRKNTIEKKRGLNPLVVSRHTSQPTNRWGYPRLFFKLSFRRFQRLPSVGAIHQNKRWPRQTSSLYDCGFLRTWTNTEGAVCWRCNHRKLSHARFIASLNSSLALLAFSPFSRERRR